MATEYFYGGKPYSLTPIYMNPISYGMKAGRIGTSVDARTANQIKEVSEQLNSGIKIVEVGGHSPEVFDAIPKDHLKELNRLAKLTKAELTFHGPMIDPAGITQHGWDPLSQKNAENQIWNAVERSHDLNPDGNVNVTFHASTAPLPGEVKYFEKGKEKSESLVYMLPDGRIGQIKAEEKFFPTEDEIKPTKAFNPKDELEKKNKEAWTETLANMNFYAHRGEEVAEKLLHLQREIEKWPKQPPKEQKEIAQALGLEEKKKEIERDLVHGDLYLRDAYRNLKKNFDDVYKYASAEDKAKLDEYAKQVQPQIKDFEKTIKDPEKLLEFSEVIQNGVKVLKNLQQPQILRSVRELAIEKAAETFSGVALKAYNQFHDTAPIISIENHPAFQSVLTTGTDIKEVVEKTRKEFIKKALSEGKMTEDEAKTQAEKLIGATWDVGHINMMRKYGYTDKELIKETEKVAPFVKKVHLSDNFGYEHTELPMGMGNVPIKEMMDRLKKGDEGFKGPQIVEALQWWQHFSPGGKTNPPFIPTLQAFGASMYQGGPTWNQVYNMPASYFSGYGSILPEQHFAMYGAGFSSLPIELGGQVQSKDSRFSGTPMA